MTELLTTFGWPVASTVILTVLGFYVRAHWLAKRELRARQQSTFERLKSNPDMLVGSTKFARVELTTRETPVAHDVKITKLKPGLVEFTWIEDGRKLSTEFSGQEVEDLLILIVDEEPVP